MSAKSKSINKNIILIVIAALLIVIPLIVVKGGEFGGSDGQAEDMVKEINSNYKPWAKNIFEPPSTEIESLLFSLQAAIGAGGICYYLGYKKGKKSKDKQ